jgi:hypothetical protein
MARNFFCFLYRLVLNNMATLKKRILQNISQTETTEITNQVVLFFFFNFMKVYFL